MSEFSDSWHIRSEHPADTVKRLRAQKFAGLAFGPQNGWLTFVPYESLPAFRQDVDPEHFAKRLHLALGLPVLHYGFYEDHGWRFSLVQSGSPSCRFACWWDPEPGTERDGLDLDALAPFASPSAIEPLLGYLNFASAAEQKPAHAFADLLGLPAFKWLSPCLVQIDTASFLADGARKVGSKPRDPAAHLPVPPNRKIALPRPDLSAREALTLVRPLMAHLEGDWFLESVSAEGGLNDHGRVPAGMFAGWNFNYHSRHRTMDWLRATLYSDGRVFFRAASPSSFFASVLPRPVPLPDQWLDSTEIAQIVAGEPLPEAARRLPNLWMELVERSDVSLFWGVDWNFGNLDDGWSKLCWAVHAATGAIMAESLKRSEGGHVVEEWVRTR